MNQCEWGFIYQSLWREHSKYRISTRKLIFVIFSKDPSKIIMKSWFWSFPGKYCVFKKIFHSAVKLLTSELLAWNSYKCIYKIIYRTGFIIDSLQLHLNEFQASNSEVSNFTAEWNIFLNTQFMSKSFFKVFLPGKNCRLILKTRTTLDAT